MGPLALWFGVVTSNVVLSKGVVTPSVGGIVFSSVGGIVVPSVGGVVVSVGSGGGGHVAITSVGVDAGSGSATPPTSSVAVLMRRLTMFFS